MGTTNVGVFRPSTGNWYLDTTKTGVVASTFHFGTSGDVTRSGRLGRERDFRCRCIPPVHRELVLRHHEDRVVASTFHFGTTGDIPKVG